GYVLLNQARQGRAVESFADRDFDDELAVTQGDIVVHHRVAERLGNTNAHFFFRMNDPGDAQATQNEMLSVRGRFHPDFADTHGGEMHDAQQAGLHVFTDGNQHHVEVFEAEFGHGGTVGYIGNDGAGESVGVFVHELGVTVDAQHRVPHFD